RVDDSRQSIWNSRPAAAGRLMARVRCDRRCSAAEGGFGRATKARQARPHGLAELQDKRRPEMR
ncbi:MAG: hypothetical protein ACKPJJ_12695, partial [Planctomycetaceae bacterium]